MPPAFLCARLGSTAGTYFTTRYLIALLCESESEIELRASWRVPKTSLCINLQPQLPKLNSTTQAYLLLIVSPVSVYRLPASGLSPSQSIHQYQCGGFGEHKTGAMTPADKPYTRKFRLSQFSRTSRETNPDLFVQRKLYSNDLYSVNSTKQKSFDPSLHFP